LNKRQKEKKQKNKKKKFLLLHINYADSKKNNLL